MKLGMITSVFNTLSFEEVVDFAAQAGMDCLEVACWPSQEGPTRKYGGTCHIDTDTITKEKAEHDLQYAAQKGITISSLGFYPNMLDPDPEKRSAYIEHLYHTIDASALMGINMVTTFIGRMQTKTIEENLQEVSKVWPPILDYARSKGVRVAIENCPMLLSAAEWPGGQNVMNTPSNWRKVFQILPYDNLGLNLDPSHFIWQQMDYIKPVYEFKDKIWHVHFKDMKILPDKLADVGILAYPPEFSTPKLPGLGDVNFGKFVSALTDIGFDGGACIEMEDASFEGSLEMEKKAILQSVHYMRNFVVR